GLTYSNLGDDQKSLEFYQQALAIYREVSNRGYEGRTLHNLGNIYYKLGKDNQSLDSYQQALDIYREILDKSENNSLVSQADEGTLLNSLGLVYHRLGNHEQEQLSYQEALTIAKEVSDRISEGMLLNNLGIAYHRLGKYEQAFLTYQQALVIHREVGSKAGEAFTLRTIGAVLAAQNQPELAIIFHKQAVNVYQSLGQDVTKLSQEKLSQEQKQSYKLNLDNAYLSLSELLQQQKRVQSAQLVLNLFPVPEQKDDLSNQDKTQTRVHEKIPYLPEEEQIKAGYEEILQQQLSLREQLNQLITIPIAERTPVQQDRILEFRQKEQQLTQEFLQFLNSSEVKKLVTQLRK
ncbi:MAG: tetratricopeptide repeat protein, partial [Moorea sp. SIO3I7]|nr:tetratricopeptide repeat protein [Moorena sp. SIO3I7]